MKILLAIVVVFFLTQSGCSDGDSHNPSVASVINQPETRLPQEVTVTYIANEGVLISSGSEQVLIDALHKPYNPAYLHTPPDVETRIINGTSPFDDIDVFLVSHVHKDHLDAQTLASFMSVQSEAALISSGQVIDSVLTYIGSDDDLRARMTRVPYETDSVSTFENNGVRVTAGKVVHGSARFRWVENLGHVIEVGGLRFLHVGDPGFGRQDIQKLLAHTDNIDVALMPSWFITEADGREVIDNVIQPQHLVVVHVTPSETGTIKRAAGEYYPEAHVFTTSMESVNFN